MLLKFPIIPLSTEELEELAKCPELFTKPCIVKNPSEKIVQFSKNNPNCGDQVFGNLLIIKNKIAQIEVKATGCILSKSSCHAVCQFLISNDIHDILKVERCDVINLVGATIPLRQRCATLAFDAIIAALEPLSNLI